ncbi:MAG: bifunctional demethylmenaquinone methyltransferase/2-methoxy-6-polyprenyl-1,4-benzoquinol methylase UbiE [Chloroflexi bacterium]|nr:bifunctional demethylmenaquinone methyltransferase/2-methoxy-6-polyprenyl-1,4-benzoquinol methylase UbiE [Chloroflexota bacterium]MBI3732140.1 bifunctional demethylmenaquinone methyltransferase/2-methoxy-6-polyprenyl-1,4-benzoquinol methylase UbiE [Chloroflexota bacterium]
MTADKSTRIQTMFSRIARRYDLMNRLMTLGRDQAWRRLAARELQLPRNGLCLDLATGTGDLALAVRARYPTARVVGMDFALAMMRVGQQKLRARGESGLMFGAADALALPFGDAQFDGLVNGFLLRNVGDLPRALAEMRRVVKPGARVACLEITRPQTPVFRELFHLYFYRLVPLIGGMIAGDRQAYTYLPNSLTPFPPADRLKALMLEAGFREVRYRLLMMGTVALHVGLV